MNKERKPFKQYCYENEGTTVELEWEDGYINRQELGGSFIYSGERRHAGKRPIILRVINKPELKDDLNFLIEFSKMLHPCKQHPIEFIEEPHE